MCFSFTIILSGRAGPMVSLWAYAPELASRSQRHLEIPGLPTPRMTSTKPNCLIVLSSAIEGVSAQSFIQAFTLTHTTFNIQLASPGAKGVEYVQQDDNSRRWLSDFRTKSFAIPITLGSVDAHRYAALLIPSAPGAVSDLAHNADLAEIIKHFVHEKKPICAVGTGVVALACATAQDQSWVFKDYSMTATSVYELSRTPSFGSIPLVPEDMIKDKGAQYSCSEPDAMHVVIDRHLITGQNEKSTLTAVQNLILLCNQKQASR